MDHDASRFFKFSVVYPSYFVIRSVSPQCHFLRSRLARMTIRVGTDCSGIEAPIQALKNLGIPHDHVFSTDTNVLCGETIRANFSPRRLSIGPEADITLRNADDVEPVDLYVCGFPCQPFSKTGHRLGMDDPRGTVFYGCVAYIRAHRPKHYVLENVKTLMTIDEGRTWEHILSLLREVPGYHVSHKIMDTKDYGIPQSRRRVYIVGVRDEEEAFVFPDPIQTPSPRPEDFVQDDAPEDDEERGSQLQNALRLSPVLEERGSVFVDILQYRTPKRVPARGFPHATCILCTSYVWCVPKRRWASQEELLSLQGFPVDMTIPIPHHRFRKQIGNAMSVNVLEHIFASLYHLPPPLPRGRYRSRSPNT